MIPKGNVDAAHGERVVAATLVSLIVVAVSIDPAMAQSLAPITNKVNSARTELVSIGQALGGLAAAGACVGWMFNVISPKWAGGIGLGGAGLAGISTISGFVNS